MEVLTNKPAEAANFYTNLFGWTTTDVDLPPVGRYTVFKLGELQVCGLLQIGRDWGVSPRWNVIYHVADCAAAIKDTQQLGGRLEYVHDVPRAGRIATLYDSGGALFVIRGPIP
jgi:predicted enzyme related to lactoylglutathione lyase